ncbi:MAG: hypothetical protein RLZZ58_1301 [Pseudomonadota bacterium]|jgi:uncharacterized metal-binding protein YceD (DUF177 family)
MSAVPPPEWSHIVAVDAVGRTGTMHLIADADARTLLARRLGLDALDRFEVHAALTATAEGILLDGRIDADVEQSCAATTLPVATRINDAFRLRFVAHLGDGVGDIADEEGIELGADDCDLVEIEDQRIDVAEAAVQSLALALPPFPRHPDADRILREKGVKAEGEAGPFAALAALKNLPT